METALGIVSVIALAVAAFLIGRLSGENTILKQNNPGTTTGQRHEMARMEDALAVIADIRVRTQLENERKEAVDHYVTERMNQLANYLSNARHDPEAPVRRPKDY
jgi:uncharacterized membrane protein